MANPNLTVILITGPPGVGKTTLVRKICSKINAHGFYTEEVRDEAGQRIGFDVVTLTGQRGILAREQPKDNVRRPRVGKYAVYIPEFEELTLPLFGKELRNQLMVLDEVGKMELFSKRFETAIYNLLQHQRHTILATIPLQTRQSIPLVEQLKQHPQTVIYEVTKSNRNSLVPRITECIEKVLNVTK